MQTIENINKTIEKNLAVMVYFSAPTCSVCHALKPKLFEELEKNFPNFIIENVDISIEEEIAPYFGVYAIPSVLIFLGGYEFIRKSRYISVSEVIEATRRPYEIMIS